jgi:hypothetical protein
MKQTIRTVFLLGLAGLLAAVSVGELRPAPCATDDCSISCDELSGSDGETPTLAAPRDPPALAIGERPNRPSGQVVVVTVVAEGIAGVRNPGN